MGNGAGHRRHTCLSHSLHATPASNATIMDVTYGGNLVADRGMILASPASILCRRLERAAAFSGWALDSSRGQVNRVASEAMRHVRSRSMCLYQRSLKPNAANFDINHTPLLRRQLCPFKAHGFRGD